MTSAAETSYGAVFGLEAPMKMCSATSANDL